MTTKQTSSLEYLTYLMYMDIQIIHQFLANNQIFNKSAKIHLQAHTTSCPGNTIIIKNKKFSP